MKILFVVSFYLCLNSIGFAQSVSQGDVLTQRVSLQVEEMPLKEVLEKLGTETNAEFAYFDRPELSEKVSLEVKGRPLGQVLHALFDGAGMDFATKGEQIIVKKKWEQLYLSGNITDKETGIPLSFATVSIKGQPVGIVSSPEGEFGLLIPEAFRNDTLFISSTGYRSFEVSLDEVKKQQSLNFQLAPEYRFLQQITIKADGKAWIELPYQTSGPPKKMNLPFWGKYTSRASYSMETQGFKKIRIDCGAGYLRLEPSPDSELKVEADIVTSSISEAAHERFLKDFLDLGLSPEDDTILLRSFFTILEYSDKGYYRSPTGRMVGTPASKINLTVKIPAGLTVKVDDNSGGIEVKGLKNDLKISDGSGDITVRKHEGNLEIKDGSNAIFLQKITGNVRINDGSGEVEVEGVIGDFYIKDASGAIVLDQVGKDENSNIRLFDRSGKLDARKLKGDVLVDDHSGRIRIRDVTGDLLIDDNTGKVDYRNVSGEVIVKE